MDDRAAGAQHDDQLGPGRHDQRHVGDVHLLHREVGASHECALDADGVHGLHLGAVTYTGLTVSTGDHTFPRARDRTSGRQHRLRRRRAAPGRSTLPARDDDRARPGRSDREPRSASFRFDEQRARLEQLECHDGSSFGAYGSPHEYIELAAGLRTFKVRAKDTFGNVDPTPASTHGKSRRRRTRRSTRSRL